jgi:hypothetical protein
MRIAITTATRHTTIEEPSGWLRILDLDQGREVANAPLPDAVHRARDPNPRGGFRGGRGIAATRERLLVAINDRVLVLDSAWRLQRVISHRWMGGVHGLAVDDHGFWVACCDNDLVIGMDWEGRLRGSWSWRSDRRLRKELGYGWMPSFDRWADHRDPLGGGLRLDVGHPNEVTIDGSRMLVMLGLLRTPPPLIWPALRSNLLRLGERAGLGAAAQGLAYRRNAFRPGGLGSGNPAGRALEVTPGAIGLANKTDAARDWTWALLELDRIPDGRKPRARVITRGPAAMRPSHDAVPAEGLVAVNDSSRNTVLAVNRQSGAVEHSMTISGENRFLRGLLHLGGSRFLVGAQNPISAYEVDLAAGRVIAGIQLSDNPLESVWGIQRVPDEFGDPSGNLPDSRADWPIPGADAREGTAEKKGDSAATRVFAQ